MRQVDDDMETRYLRAQRARFDFSLIVPNKGAALNWVPSLDKLQCPVTPIARRIYLQVYLQMYLQIDGGTLFYLMLGDLSQCA